MNNAIREIKTCAELWNNKRNMTSYKVERMRLMGFTIEQQIRVLELEKEILRAEREILARVA